jgi:hypothetical protein
VAHSLRHHVPAHLWASQPGTDFWLLGGHADIVTTGAADVAGGLSGWGWTTTALSLTTGSAGDFLSSSDKGVHTGISIGAASDLLQSPVIFGDYAHGLQAAQFLGYYPTQLNLEVYATFTVINTASDTTGFGLVEDGGSAIVGADQLAYVTSNGTNFLFRSGAANDASIAVADTNAHLFRIKVTSASVEWFIDDVSQGAIALEADEWPVSFGAGALATTGANFFHLHHAHLWYE